MAEIVNKNIGDWSVITCVIQVQDCKEARHLLNNKKIVSDVAPFVAEDAEEGAEGLNGLHYGAYPGCEWVQQLSIVFAKALFLHIFTAGNLLAEPSASLHENLHNANC